MIKKKKEEKKLHNEIIIFARLTIQRPSFFTPSYEISIVLNCFAGPVSVTGQRFFAEGKLLEKLDHLGRVSSRVISTPLVGIPYPSHLLSTSPHPRPSPPSRLLSSRPGQSPPAPLLSTAPRVVISLWLRRSPSSPYFEGGGCSLACSLAGCLPDWPIYDGVVVERNGRRRPTTTMTRSKGCVCVCVSRWSDERRGEEARDEALRGCCLWKINKWREQGSRGGRGRLGELSKNGWWVLVNIS